jgi:hypothetical protein
MELDGGELVESSGGSVVLTLPPDRAHGLAHAVDGVGWAALSRTLDDVAAGLGDPAALVCSARLAGSVPAERRLAAVELLGGLSAVQRVAVVDAASRWLGEDAGGELAYALLSAVCPSDAATTRAFLALLGPSSL